MGWKQFEQNQLRLFRKFLGEFWTFTVSYFDQIFWDFRFWANSAQNCEQIWLSVFMQAPFRIIGNLYPVFFKFLRFWDEMSKDNTSKGQKVEWHNLLVSTKVSGQTLICIILYEYLAKNSEQIVLKTLSYFCSIFWIRILQLFFKSLSVFVLSFTRYSVSRYRVREAQ